MLFRNFPELTMTLLNSTGLVELLNGSFEKVSKHLWPDLRLTRLVRHISVNLCVDTPPWPVDTACPSHLPRVSLLLVTKQGGCDLSRSLR